MSITIEKVKEKRIKLESDILKLVTNFEKETGTITSYINFSRKTALGKESNSPICVPEPEREGPVKNVEVSLRFDI